MDLLAWLARHDGHRRSRVVGTERAVAACLALRCDDCLEIFVYDEWRAGQVPSGA